MALSFSPVCPSHHITRVFVKAGINDLDINDMPLCMEDLGLGNALQTLVQHKFCLSLSVEFSFYSSLGHRS